MKDGVIVREAAERDLLVLAELMTDLGYPTSVEEMSRRLEEIAADPSYCTPVAEEDGQVLGVAGLHRARHTMRSRPHPHGGLRCLGPGAKGGKGDGKRLPSPYRHSQRLDESPAPLVGGAHHSLILNEEYLLGLRE